MNEIRQHIPSFMDGFEKETAEFDTVDKLLAKPFVKRWAETPGFDHFAIRDNCLMAILRGGRSWWVVGYLKEPVDLPKWDGGLYEVIDQSGTVVDVPASDVRSSYGDIVELRDGRKLKRAAHAAEAIR